MLAPARWSWHLAGTVGAVVVLAGTACGRGDSPVTPASPTPTPEAPIADFAGAWHGQYRMATCTGVRLCFAMVGTDRPYGLTLTQSGRDVVGVFTSDGAVVDVKGRVVAQGQLQLEAAPPAVETDVSGFTRFQAALTLAGPELSGALEFTIGAPYFGSLPPGAYTRTGDIRSSSRDGLSPVTSYDGSWRGEYIVRTCTPTGWPDCHWAEPAARYPFDMTLAQTGDTVTGTITLTSKTIPVTGTVDASGLTLFGAVTTAISGGSETTRIERWTGRRDAVGRLSGQLHVVDETAGLTPAPMSMTFDAELVGVVFVP